MLISHVPAGYIITRIADNILSRQQIRAIHRRAFYFWAFVGSVFPDIDMFYYYFIDKRQHLHHEYLTHIPFFWICSISLTMLFSAILKKHAARIYIYIFSINIFLHLFLDTLIGKIKWLYPFSEKFIFFFDVPTVYDNWIWNFVIHWTFMIEILIVLIAFKMLLNSTFSNFYTKELKEI